MNFYSFLKMVLLAVISVCASVSQAQDKTRAWDDVREINGVMQTKLSSSCLTMGYERQSDRTFPNFKNTCDFPIVVAWCYKTYKHHPNCFGEKLSKPYLMEEYLPLGRDNPKISGEFGTSHYGYIWLNPNTVKYSRLAVPKESDLIDDVGDRNKNVLAVACAHPREKIAKLFPRTQNEINSGEEAVPVPTADFANRKNPSCEIFKRFPNNFIGSATYER